MQSYFTICLFIVFYFYIKYIPIESKSILFTLDINIYYLISLLFSL